MGRYLAVDLSLHGRVSPTPSACSSVKQNPSDVLTPRNKSIGMRDLITKQGPASNRKPIMLRTYVNLQQRLNALRDRLAGEDGTTVPEYMLVLGFISVAIVVAFNTTGLGTAIGALSSDLITKITPAS
jgi:Flp pilus assembly pilin Flp